MFFLKPLTVEDSATLEEIHLSCFPDAWSRATFDQLLAENLSCGWMAISDGAPVGFLLTRALKDEAEILTFAVRPSFQKEGVGRCLLKQLIIFFNAVGCGRIFLEVAVDNEAAINLYRSEGFSIVGTRPNYYQRTQEDFVAAYIMAWVKEEKI